MANGRVTGKLQNRRRLRANHWHLAPFSEDTHGQAKRSSFVDGGERKAEVSEWNYAPATWTGARRLVDHPIDSQWNNWLRVGIIK